MITWRRNLLISLLALSARIGLHAEIISEALFSFPAKTEYVEYDNLTSLRTLTNYNTLRQRFSGKPLEDAKAALGRLGIQEDQVHEIVSGSSSNAFYVLVAGTFSGQAAAIKARQKGFAGKLLDKEVFCPGKAACVVFLEDSLAAYGTTGQLKDILEARQGFISRLSSNHNITSLLNNTERRAPVRGVLFGSQLNSMLSDMLQDWTGWKRDWSPLSASLRAVGYSVRFDSKAHVGATLECTSTTTAALLVQTLSALSSLSSASASGDGPFQNLQISSSGDVVDFKADAAIPTDR